MRQFPAMLSRISAMISAFLIFCFVASAASAQSPLGGLPLPQSFQECVNCPKMVVIPPGKFMMGTNDAQAEFVVESIPEHQNVLADFMGMSDRKLARDMLAREQPQHSVNIGKSFAVSEFMITKSQFSEFVHATGYTSDKCTLWTAPRITYLNKNGWVRPGFDQGSQSRWSCPRWQRKRQWRLRQTGHQGRLLGQRAMGSALSRESNELCGTWIKQYRIPCCRNNSIATRRMGKRSAAHRSPECTQRSRRWGVAPYALK